MIVSIGLFVAAVVALALLSPFSWRFRLLPAAMLGLAFLAVAIFVWLLWVPWARRFPAQPVAEGAEVRRFQYVTLGLIGGFNGCATVASDARFVHLSLMAPLSWIAPGTISLPRERLRARSGGSWPVIGVRAEIDGRRVVLPAWTFDARTSLDGEGRSGP